MLATNSINSPRLSSNAAAGRAGLIQRTVRAFTLPTITPTSGGWMI